MRKIAAILALTILPATAFAAGPIQPYDIGRVLDQVKEKPAAPLQKPARIENELQPGAAPSKPSSGVQVTVKGFRITGATAFSESELQKVLAPFKERQMSLEQLQQVSAALTGYYHEKGYFVAYAYLPPQEIKDGLIQIAVLEGSVDKVQLKKAGQTRIADGVILRGMRGVQHGTILVADQLENRLLLLNDLPGLEVSADLQPGSTTGSADLVLNVKEKGPLSLSLNTDNYGNRFSGEYRGGLTVNLNDPFGMGDQLTLYGITGGEGLYTGKATYLAPFGSRGAKLGVSYAYLHYQLDDVFQALHQNGTSQIGSLFLSQPLAVNRSLSLYGQLSYDYKSYRDSVQTVVSSKHVNGASASLLMNSQDGFASGGVTNLSLVVSGGSLLLDNGLSSQDSAHANTEGMFGKANLYLSRLQSLGTGSTFLYLSFDGQQAFNNLDTTEKYSLGGPSGVLAYPGGEASGDNGFVGSAELRQNLTFLRPVIPGDLQLTGFFDAGLAQMNEEVFIGGDKQTRSRAGAGIGLNWGVPGNFSLRASAAWVTGGVPARISDGTDDRAPRCWFQGVKWF